MHLSAHRRRQGMKPFVINRYGRMVFPFSFFPELDFSVFETLDQFAAVIRRDFEDKAPSENDIVSKVDAGDYRSRYELLRDLALNLFWVNRYAMTMYEKRPTRWRDVPRLRDDVFLPVFTPWDGAEPAATVEGGYRALRPTWDEAAEDKVFRILPGRTGGVLRCFRRGRSGRPGGGVGSGRGGPRPRNSPVPPINVRARFAVQPRLEGLDVDVGECGCANDALVRDAAYCWSPRTA